MLLVVSLTSSEELFDLVMDLALEGEEELEEGDERPCSSELPASLNLESATTVKPLP